MKPRWVRLRYMLGTTVIGRLGRETNWPTGERAAPWLGFLVFPDGIELGPYPVWASLYGGPRQARWEAMRWVEQNAEKGGT